MLTHARTHSLAALDDAGVTRGLVVLVGQERGLLVEFLHHLAEFDSRKLYLALGYSSLYAYCRDCLKLSDGSAFRRYTVARLLMRFPAIADFLREGRLTLVRIATLREVLTPENHLDLLQRATLGSERDVEVLAATLRPAPDVRDSVRRVSSTTVTSTLEVGSTARGHRSTPHELPPEPTAEARTSTLEVTAARQPAQPPAPHEMLATSTLEVGSTARAHRSTPHELPPEPPAEARTSTLEVTAGRQPAQPPAPHEMLATSTLEVNAVSAPAQSPESTELLPTSTMEVRAPRANRMEVQATSATAFSVRMRVGPEFLAEFESVKAALSHRVPDGNFEAVMRECFRVTLEACNKRRAAATRRCGTAGGTAGGTVGETMVETEADSRSPSEVDSESAPGACASPRLGRSRYIPAPIRRAVWKRDDGRCAFVAPDGKRCDSRHQIEIHHKEPFALGGPSTEDNLSLRCRRHNAWEGELFFGPSPGTSRLERDG